MLRRLAVFSALVALTLAAGADSWSWNYDRCCNFYAEKSVQAIFEFAASDLTPFLISCDMDSGPDHWPSYYCDSAEQSPIDICGAVTRIGGMPALSPQGSLYSTAQYWQFKTDGQAYISPQTATMLLDAQDLAHIVGRQANPSTDIDNADGDNNANTGIDYPKWYLAQAHFHWYAQK